MMKYKYNVGYMYIARVICDILVHIVISESPCK